MIGIEPDGGLITPDSFEEIARLLYNGKGIETGVVDSGFVCTSHLDPLYVGLRESDRVYVVAEMTKRTEVIGRTEPKIKTTENEYVRVDLRRVELPRPPSDMPIEQLGDAFEHGEAIDTGYLHGYRVTPLSEVLSETFKWYDQSAGSNQ